MTGRTHLRFVEPMKASTVEVPPTDGQWLYEVKFDGFRVLAIKNRRTVELWSRNHKPLHDRFPEIVTAVARLRAGSFIIDGEICALDDQGKSSFQLLQNQRETGHPVVYYAFDLLFQGSKDLRMLPLRERKKRLGKLLPRASGPLHPSAFFLRDPRKILATMESAGAEGAVAKLATSPYESGRRPGSWVKIKFRRGQEFVIVGYTLPQKSRHFFGALLLGYYQKKRLIFAGRVGTGFSDKTLKEVFSKMQPLISEKPPVADVQWPSGRWRPKGWRAADTRWVKPKLVAQVQFTEWTEEGLLRHPSFQGLREDKAPREIVRE